MCDVVDADGRRLRLPRPPRLVFRRRGVDLLQQARHEGGVSRAVHPFNDPASGATNAPAAHVKDVDSGVKVVADECEDVRVRSIVEDDGVSLENGAQGGDVVA